MRTEFGMGRLTKDTDYIEEQLLEAQATAVEADAIANAPWNKGREYLICRSCGQGGYRGNYPMSTAPDSGFCDDCL